MLTTLHRTLTLQNKVAIFYKRDLDIRSILQIPDNEITASLMRQQDCSFQDIMCAMSIPEFYERGANTVSMFREFGMDAFDLSETLWTNDLVRLFGSDAVINTFLTTAADARILSGSQGAAVLNISTDRLLLHCKGDPVAAEDVLLHRLSDATDVDIIIRTNITKEALTRVGIGVVHLVESMKASPSQLAHLGYGLSFVKNNSSTKRGS